MKPFSLFLFSIILGCLTINFSCTTNTAKNRHQAPKMSPQDQFAKGRLQENNKNYSEAFQWYKKAALANHVLAQYRLGVLYEEGYGVSQDCTEAAKWYRKSADQGYTSAQIDLGVLYVRGCGVPQNYTQALHWYKQAVDQGHRVAQYNLGLLYLTGSGVAKSANNAAYWFKKSANQGYAAAQNLLGDLYYNGNGVRQDYNQAVRWYEKAARQNYAGAQDRLKSAEQKRRDQARAMASRSRTPKYQQKATQSSDPAVSDPWKAVGELLGIYLKYQESKQNSYSGGGSSYAAPSGNSGNCTSDYIKGRLVYCYNKSIEGIDAECGASLFNNDVAACESAVQWEMEHGVPASYWWCDKKTHFVSPDKSKVIEKICR